MLINYFFVSKTDGSQSPHLQRDALELAGVDLKNVMKIRHRESETIAQD